jgi:MFS transporter, OFA family, oxalate/formate antiporter
MERNPQRGARSPAHRWLQLALGVVCMVMVANLQYGWSLFVYPIDAKYQWGRADIQVAFTIFVLATTWLMPVAGYLSDRFGARRVAMAGGLLVAMAWGLNAYAASLAGFYLNGALGGAGAGAVYGACVGNALKWFPDQRGLAVGLTAAGFGTVSAATVLPIHAVILAHGYEGAFLYFGLGQGAIVLLAAAFLAQPPQPAADHAALATSRHYGPLEVLRAPAFWVMYLMFFMVAAAGLMAMAQLAPIAKDYKVANSPVSILDLTLPALAFALAIDRVFSGLTRPIFGWVSDRLGRERAMSIAFGLEAAAIVALALCGRDPLWFVLLTGLIFFGWGEIYSLFPAACADTFGARHAATHAGLLYTAKGAAALVVLFFSATLLPTAEWHATFYCAAGMNAVAATLALLVLKPLRARQITNDRGRAAQDPRAAMR